LSDQDDLMDPLFRKVLGLLEHGGKSSAPIGPPNLRHGTESTEFRTPFGDFDVGSREGRGKDSGRFFIIEKNRRTQMTLFFRFLGRFLGKDLGKFLKRACPYEEIHLRQFLLKGFPIPLRKASWDDQTPAASLFLVTGQIKNRIDGFPGGILDKRTGVDDEDFSLRRIRSKKIAFLGKESQHDLWIDQIFGTSEAH
jgi:hypothetical protein